MRFRRVTIDILDPPSPYYLFYPFSSQKPDDALSSPSPLQNSDSKQHTMTNMLDQWGAETPFILPEDKGINVLTVSLRVKVPD